MGAAVRPIGGARWLALGAVLFWLAAGGNAIAAAAGTNGPAPSGPGLEAYSNDGQTLAVHPLDDPANPYHGQYGQLETWVVAHAEPYSAWKASADQEMARMRAAAGPGGMLPKDFKRMQVVSVLVDAAGWVLPSGQRPDSWSDLFKPRSPQAELNREGMQAASPAAPRYFIVAPGDDLPAEIKAQLAAQQDQQRLSHAPRIPAWLGTRPPLEAIFVPNGDILTYGELDKHYAPAPWDDGRAPSFDHTPQGETWYRYSADGQLLGKLEHSDPFLEQWIALYWPQMQQTLGAFPHGDRPLQQEYHGFWVGLAEMPPAGGTAPAPRKLYAAWTYEGQPLDVDQPLAPELVSVSSTHWQQDIGDLYALEVKYGLTDPRAVSPYAGRADGPQAVDPAPLPWPRVANGGVPDGRGSIRVLPRDAADNPYRGQYTAWDDWVWQQYAARNPNEKLGAPGQSIAQPVNYYSVWRELWLPVDAQGALLPLAQAGLAEARSRLGFDHRSPRGWDWRTGAYQFNANGELDDAQWTQFMAEKLRLTLALYPTAPDWLASQPAAHVVFVPNGDIVTYGPLGSFDTAPDTKYADRFKAGATAPWYVYGADGQLKGTVPSGGEWVQFYRSDALKAQLAADTAAGRFVNVVDGITVVFAGPTYTTDANHYIHWVEPQPALVAAYAWDGTPLDTAQPLTLPDYHNVTLDWHAVQWAHAASALAAGPDPAAE